MIDKLTYNIQQGDSKSLIDNIESYIPYGDKVHCVVTSPPYFNQKKYGNNDESEIGREKTVDDFVNNLVDLFNRVPLHPRGSVWVNIWDKRDKNGALSLSCEKFVLAMQESGWHMVDKVIWAKAAYFDDGTSVGSPQPEPAYGRLNSNCFEYLYRFVRDVKEAWADTCAVRVPRKGGDNEPYLPEELMSITTSTDGRNLGNVWQTKSGQTNKKHYATYPESLISRPIAMTCPMFLDQSTGEMSERLVEFVEYDEKPKPKKLKYKELDIFGDDSEEEKPRGRVFGKYTGTKTKEEFELNGRCDVGKTYVPRKPETVGWTLDNEKCHPGIVFDPFCGSGTTAAVALKLGRSFVGFDLYENYCDMTRVRCEEVLKNLRDKNINPIKDAR